MSALTRMPRRHRSRLLALAIAAATAGGAAALGLPALAAAADAPPPTLPLTGGTFDWGVKQSFRGYVTGIAAGTITTADGATANDDGTYRFTHGTGTYDTSTHSVTVAFDGSVEFASTLHGFDIKLADIKLTTTGTTGTLTADVTSAGTTSEDVDFAALDLSAATAGHGSDGSITYDAIATALTADGAQAFNGMYQAGTALDPANLAVTAGSATTTPATTPPTTPPTTAPTTAPSTEPATTGPTTGPTTTAPATTDPATTAPAAPTGTDADTDEGTGATVVDGNLDWGVKESFRSYVTGPIADGKAELSGGAANTAAGYRFPKGTGTWDADGKALNVSFAGGVHFLGHLTDGTYLLDLSFSNLKVTTSGSTGTLTADVTSKDMSTGKSSSYDDLDVATLSKVSPTVNGEVVTVSSAAASLTADGAGVFSGFYQAGDALDPVTVAVSLEEGAALPTASTASTGTSAADTSYGAATVGGTGGTTDGATLASTGSDTPVPLLLGAAAALVVTGAAATALVARSPRPRRTTG
ncbi:HtaA domain-containing protein [Streptomyces sp. CA2R106]|uniref:HtaA domain-containing protein n=1 Tax=Streptomyces sp. CA2R106 TaxID=3120153 RepID=UPI00300886C0